MKMSLIKLWLLIEIVLCLAGSAYFLNWLTSYPWIFILLLNIIYACLALSLNRSPQMAIPVIVIQNEPSLPNDLSD